MITGRFEQTAFKGISIDTRTLEAGNLFFALTGENYNGQDFIPDAKRKGAAGVVVSQPVETLGKLTQRWRKKFSIPVIGLTGSSGKTTVKNMLGSILAETQQSVLITQGNMNNHLGVPLTLARLNQQHAYAVIEMGMNHFGEIAYLSKLVRPTTALITNAGPCHLEGAGNTIEGVAQAKAEIFEGLSEQGIAVINADDNFADYWQTRAYPKKIMTYGIENSADVRGELALSGFILHYQQQQIFIRLNLLGAHNIRNALGAAAASIANGISLIHIKNGLEKVQPEHGRMEIKEGLHPAVRVVDDSYNANPLSLKAAIEAIMPYPQQKILVLGDMKELGEQAVSLHHECGEFARQKGIDMLFAVGMLSAHAVKSFGQNAKHFEDQASLITALQAYLQVHPEVLVLIKGSRSMQMEKVVQVITRV